MIEPPLHPNEINRLATLRSLKILDTPTEERFERITRTAQRLFNVPIVLISLVDENRQWFKSCIGLEASETSRSVSFCAHAILSDEPFIIPDATKDFRFADNPSVIGEPFVRFYAGRCLKAFDGACLGTLCLISPEPREMSATELQALNDLATWAEDELSSLQQDQMMSLVQEKESRLRAVLDNVVDGILTLSNDGTISSLNLAGEHIFGYQTNEVMGQNIKLLIPDFYHSSDDGYLISQGISKISGFGREMVGRRKDGATFPVDFAVSQMPVGEQTLYTAICRDISERKQAEKDLQYQREFTSNLVQNAAVATFVIDIKHKVVFWNAAIEELTGLKADEMIGTENHPLAFYEHNRVTLADILIDNSFDKLPEFYSNFTQSSALIKNALHAESWFSNLNGKRRYMVFDASPVFNSEGELIAAIETMQDITAQKKIEEAYRESEEKLRTVISNAPISIFSLDPNGILTFMEGKGLESQGLKPGQLVGLSAFDVYKGLPKILENTRRALKGETFNISAEVGDRVLELFNAPVWSDTGELISTIGVSVDVTERRQAEAELEQQRNFALQVMSTMGQGLIVVNEDDRLFRYANPTFCKMIGYTAEELANLATTDIIHRKDHLKVGQAWINRPADKPAEVEVRLVRSDGRVIHTLLSLVPSWQDDKVVGTIAVVTDLTERKRAEETLRASEEKYRSIIAAMEEGILFLDAEGRILSSNASAERILGIESENMAGLTPSAPIWSALREDGSPFPSEERPALVTLRTGQPCSNVIIGNQKPDGTLSWLSANSQPVFREDMTKPYAVVCTFTDITLRKQGEEALRESEERFHLLSDATIEGVVIHEHGKILDGNRTMEMLFGYELTELIGKNAMDLIGAEWQSAVREKIFSGYEQSSEATAVRKDGTLFPIEFTTRSIPYQGRRVRVTAIRDITERQKVERLKHEFISTVSHELRTPLTSIRGSLGLVAGGMVGEIPPQAKVMLDIAYKNSERLVLLINDILDIEKIESGQMSFNLQPLELLPLVEQSIEANRAYGDQYKVKFILGTTLPKLKVKTDSNRLMQVLTNLLSNAAKFSKPDDTVVIAMAKQGQDVRVSVTDHGSGIPDEFRSRIFQKFAQADGSSTRAKGGSGLGLSIAKAIVERSGGRMGYETTLGAGTTFYFDLPIHQEKKEELPALNRSRQPSVLIVEDDSDVASLLGLLLGQAGFTTEIARDAEEAKQQLAQTQFDAMTLDLMLPGQDGLALMRELREQPSTRNLPIVIVSAKKSGSRQELGNQAIAVIDWVDKPIKQKQLISAVKRATRKVQGARPKILHIEDDYDVLGVVALLLQEVADISSATSLAEAQRKMSQANYDLILLDLELPDGNGLSLFQDLQKSPIPVVIFSASEISRDLSRKVAGALVKSRTTNRELLETIRGLVGFGELVNS